MKTFLKQILNVSLSDDADFECQVGPANYNKPIRAAAHLHVLRKLSLLLSLQCRRLWWL